MLISSDALDPEFSDPADSIPDSEMVDPAGSGSGSGSDATLRVSETDWARPSDFTRKSGRSGPQKPTGRVE